MTYRTFARRFGPFLAGVLVMLMLVVSGCAISGGAGVPGAGFNAGVGLSESGKPTLSFGLKLDLVESGCAIAKLVRADRFEAVKGFCPQPAVEPEDFTAEELDQAVPASTTRADEHVGPFAGWLPAVAVQKPRAFYPMASRWAYPSGDPNPAGGVVLAGVLAPLFTEVRRRLLADASFSPPVSDSSRVLRVLDQVEQDIDVLEQHEELAFRRAWASRLQTPEQIAAGVAQAELQKAGGDLPFNPYPAPQQEPGLSLAIGADLLSVDPQ